MSFEPHPSFYSYLFDNIQLNKSTNIKSYNFGLSNERDKLYFSNNNDTMNFVQIKKEVDSIVVDVERLTSQQVTDSVAQLAHEGTPEVG
jgi:hypothetical protein